MHQYIEFNNHRKVAEAGLEFLKLIDARLNIEARPTIFLTKNETTEAEVCWGGKSACTKRIILAPGGGFPEKCWGDHNFTQLTNLLLKNRNSQICIIGSKEDQKRITFNQASHIKNLCGKLSLRQSAAMVSLADYVICNSSLCMHLQEPSSTRSNLIGRVVRQ